MTDFPTLQVLATAAPLIALMLAIWWKVEGRIDNAKGRAEQVAVDFAKYQTHVAETYVSKQGLREVRDEIMTAIESVNGNLGRINDRIDRFSDQPVRRNRTTGV